MARQPKKPHAAKKSGASKPSTSSTRARARRAPRASKASAASTSSHGSKTRPLSTSARTSRQPAASVLKKGRTARTPKSGPGAATATPNASAAERQLLRHTLATLAYRAHKVLREVPADFSDLRVGPTARTPAEILSHLADLMEWGVRFARGESRWQAGGDAGWAEALVRFSRGLEALDAALEASEPDARPLEVIYQGPIADALTHVGQLALLRGLSGAPVRPESYALAEVEVGRVGAEQAPARYEFQGDASRRRPV